MKKINIEKKKMRQMIMRRRFRFQDEEKEFWIQLILLLKKK